MTAEPWWRTTTIYQVYPRSFADADGDGIGDLPGVIDHLDHLVELGVGAVWLSPFFASPQRDVGYDVSDFRSVAPEYGTLDDAQRLIDRAHELGLRVLFDLVLNHTSDEHPWFLESRSSRTGPRADWYVWSNGRQGRRGRRRPPNNWRSELQVTPRWQWSDEREQWYLASFLPFQPDLNWRNPELRAEMFDTVRTWLARGVDGFRLDIFGSIMQDADLRDNRRRPVFTDGLPRLQTPDRTMNTDDNFVLAADLRAVCDEFDGDRVLLGEVFGPASTLRRYLRDRDRDGLHLVFLFEFLASRYRAAAYRELIVRYEQDLATPLLPTYVLENHDRTRSMSRVGRDEDKARVLAALLCTLRGVPVIYQGQEIGMQNRYIPLRDALDPVPHLVARWLPEAVNRRLSERLNRDEVRTPMQWDGSAGAGFTPAGVGPWLPIHDDHTTRNVAAQRGDPGSLLRWYRALLRLRAETPALHGGTLTLDETATGELVVYERRTSGQCVLVAANLGDEAASLPAADGASLVLRSRDDVTLAGGRLHLPGHRAAVVDLPVDDAPPRAEPGTAT